MHALFVEVGSRGHNNTLFQRMCDVLGFTNAETQELKKVVEKTAMLCSHAIFIERFKLPWQKRPLVDLFGEQ